MKNTKTALLFFGSNSLANLWAMVLVWQSSQLLAFLLVVDTILNISLILFAYRADRPQ